MNPELESSPVAGAGSTAETRPQAPTHAVGDGTGSGSASASAWFGLSKGARPEVRRRVGGRKVSSVLLLLLVVLGSFAALFVGSDVIVRFVFPEVSTAVRHALLTAQAAVATAVASAAVYLFMRRQERRLSATAEQLTRILGSYQSDPSVVQRFENPHLVDCVDAVDCPPRECVMRGLTGERCWQTMALHRAAETHQHPKIEIDKCLECDVYKLSCPDKLTELGESLNNLLFLLEVEAGQLGRMRAQMVEKEKMVAIGQMAAGIAHEVGNPLSSISSIVQMLKRSRTSGHMAEQLDLIETHIQRISATVRQLVSLARPSAEQWELVDLGVTLEDAVKLLAFDRRARKTEIAFEQLESLPRTYALRGQMQQVFINLALNALDAMPDGGRLTVQAQNELGKIVVRFQDTGRGIPPEVGRRVFEPFFTTKEPGEGTGLGLAVSYGIVQKHGGSISFESTGGEGTVFTVELPILDKTPDI